MKTYTTTEAMNKMALVISASATGLGVVSSTDGITVPVDFVDYPFMKPTSYDDHIAGVKRYRPNLAIAPDVSDGRELHEVIDIADQLLEYADDVAIVPKECHPSEIPDRFVAGYPAANYGEGMRWGAWDFAGKRVHILGGSPRRQREIARHVNAVSADTASILKGASFGNVWAGDHWHRVGEAVPYYARVLASAENYATRTFENVSGGATSPNHGQNHDTHA